MHSCPPPLDHLKKWLLDTGVETKGYGHLLLEEKDLETDTNVDGLRPYFESAHLDARTVIHKFMGMELHPDGPVTSASGLEIQYPSGLPQNALRGLFGETLSGLITEGYYFVGNHEWSIPVFLFREFEAARNYLHDLVQDPTKEREIFGRKGTDFLAIAVDASGNLVRFLSGEAKWRKTLTESAVKSLLESKAKVEARDGKRGYPRRKGIWEEINEQVPAPTGLRQLQQILEQEKPTEYEATILSIDKALQIKSRVKLQRTDLIFFVGTAGKFRCSGDTHVPADTLPPEYKAGNDLQIVEMYLKDGEHLLNELFSSLWAGDDSEENE